MCGLYAGCETSPPNYTHAIRTQRLVKEKNKMSDIQGGDLFANETLFPHSQCWLKYYILKKPTLFTQIPGILQFIAIPVGKKYQQGNVTPGSILLHTHSYQD